MAKPILSGIFSRDTMLGLAIHSIVERSGPWAIGSDLYGRGIQMLGTPAAGVHSAVSADRIVGLDTGASYTEAER